MSLRDVGSVALTSKHCLGSRTRLVERALTLFQSAVKYKDVHKCTWHHNTLGHRSMIDFGILSSDLWLYVLNLHVKRETDRVHPSL